MELLGVAEAIAVGHSMGAQVTTALAVRHPARVAAPAVIDPAYGADADEERHFAERLAALRTEGSSEAVRQLGRLPDCVREQLLATPGHVLAECYRGMYITAEAFGTRRAAEKYLPDRACPVLSLHSQAKPAAWAAVIPAPSGSRVVTWPGTGHFLHLEHPAAFATLLTEWLIDSLS